ncbi:MAG: molybdopterin-dependent oxidoreductase [Bacteroidota bacterium]
MKENLTEEQLLNKKIRNKSLISFGVFFLLISIAIVAWMWVRNSAKSDGQYKPLRGVLNANEKINNFFFTENDLVKTYPKSEGAKDVRANGYYGNKGSHDTAVWRLRVLHSNPQNPGDSVLILSLNDILQIPKQEECYNFKCVEGWSQISFWGGCRFYDFISKYKLGTHSGNAPDKNHPEDLYKYVSLESSDGAYYVGIDMKSMIHSQTLLAYEMNEKPLPDNQGYPLRLIIPLKYGIKNLKWIGTIRFSDTRPKDYWFERGYDYDAAL